MYNLQFTIYNLQFAICNLQFAIYNNLNMIFFLNKNTSIHLLKNNLKKTSTTIGKSD